MKKLVRRRAKNIIGAFVSGIGFIGFGLLVLMMSGRVGIDVETQNAEDISYLSMEEDNVYWIEELTVVDCYAKREESGVHYFIVSYEDMRGNTVLASLSVNSSEDPWDATQNYLDDADARVGDCVLKGYYELREDKSEDAVTRASYFSNGVSNHKKDGNIPLSAVSLRSVLRYKCDTYDELVALSDVTGGVTKFMAIFSMAIGVLAIYAGFRWISINKKLDAQEAAAKKTSQQTLNQVFADSGMFSNAQVRKVAPAQPTQPAQPARPTAPAQPVAPVQPAAPAAPVAPVAPVQQPAAPVSDKMAKLNEYKALVDAGYMTQEEFDQKRKEILQLT